MKTITLSQTEWYPVYVFDDGCEYEIKISDEDYKKCKKIFKEFEKMQEYLMNLYIVEEKIDAAKTRKKRLRFLKDNPDYRQDVSGAPFII